MGDTSRATGSLRVLLTEGGSTSAREAITVLGLAGHLVEVCDPDPRCLARFSKFVTKFHRCPGLREDPIGYLTFVEALLTTRRIDVLLPIHEQGFLFARFQQRLPSSVGVALPSFESYRIAHSKASFSQLLDELALPQPPTHPVTSETELRAIARLPCIIKTSVGTASRGIWVVDDEASLNLACHDLHTDDGFADGVLVQDLVAGVTEHAQAVFCRGQLIGFHAYRQLAAGAGGGDARKKSVRRPGVQAQIARIGERLDWHGALSVDYILSSEDAPLYVDCNPRLVEPMSAWLADLDLVELLLQVSQGVTPSTAPMSCEGVRTHLSMQALLGCALRGGTRRDIARECARLFASHRPYENSTEELTPVRLDWISAVPVAMTALLLLITPKLANRLAKNGWGQHLLGANSIRLIENEFAKVHPTSSAD